MTTSTSLPEPNRTDTRPVRSCEDHHDAVEAHYSGLERPHACMDGWVFVGYIDEDGEEREASYRCRRCGDNA